MTGAIATIPRQQFFDQLGKPLAGGKLTTYLAGTTTPIVTYQDQDLTIANPTTITLDSTGSCLLWLDPTKSYKFLLKNALGVTQPGWPVDNISGAATPVSLTPTLSPYAKLTTLAASAGASLIGFIQAVANAVKRTTQDKLSDEINVFDVIPLAQRAAIEDGTSVYDAQPVLQALIDDLSARAFGGTIIGPVGKFKMGASLTLKDKVSLVGQGKGFTLEFGNAAQDGLVIGGSAAQSRRSVRNVTLAGTARDMFVCANWPVEQAGGLKLDVENISIASGSVATNGFTFANVYASAFRNLTIDGATISNACFRFLASVNGVTFDNLYTGGGNGHLYCFYIDSIARPTGDTTLPSGHGILFNSPVAQGGKYGFYIERARGITINNPYFENVANQVATGVLGLDAISVRGLTINGGTYGSCYDYNPYYAQRGPIWRFAHTVSVIINAPETFQQVNALPLTITGGGGTSAQAYVLVNRDGSPAGYVVAHCGRNFTTAPAITAPAPSTGTADTLTATITGSRLTGITVTTPGASPKYPIANPYPVYLLYGAYCSKIKVIAPYTGVSGDTAPFHAFIGRDSTAQSTCSVDVDADSCVDGQIITTRKTEGFGFLHAHSFLDSTGAPVSFVTTPPLIAAP